MAHIVLVGATALLLIAIVFLIVRWIRRRRYTRERFAYAIVSVATSMVAVAVATFPAQEMPWEAVIRFFAQSRGLEYQPQPARPADYVLFLTFLTLVLIILRSIHRDWDGPISVQQHKRERLHEPPSMTSEALAELRRRIGRKPPWDIYEPRGRTNLGSMLADPLYSLAWHEQSRELLCLRHRTFEFDEANGWDSELKFWTGVDRRTGNHVFLYCPANPTNDAELGVFVGHARQRIHAGNVEQMRLIVAEPSDTPGRRAEIQGHGVSIQTEQSLLTGLVDFIDYFKHIERRARRDHLPDSTLTLEDMYVPSNYRVGESNVVNENIEFFLQEWSNDPTRRQLALLAEYGQGKSTCALLFCKHVISGKLDCSGRVPILLELRGKSPRDMEPEDLLATWARPYGIDARALMRLLIAGRLILVLEGFDEMALVGDMEMRLNHFRTLWRFCYPKSKILITGRPNFFLDDEEMKSALGISDPLPGKPYCQAVQLMPFSEDQIREALRNTDRTTQSEIVQLAGRDKKFFEIVSRPSLLYLVSQLWKDEGLAKHVGEINSAFVMDLFIQATYQRQIQKIEGKPDFMMLSPEERSFFMLGIAAYMAANKLPNQITVHQLDDAVSKLFAVIPQDISETSSAMSGKTPRPLRERLRDNESALETIGTDVRAAGLLVVDPTRSGAFRFAHKSFLEFLSAKVMAEKLWAKTDTATAIATATELELSKVGEVGSECVDFLAELLNNRIVESAEVQYESKGNFAASLYQIIVGGGEKLSVIGKYAVGEYLARLRMLQSRASVWSTLTRSFFSRSTLVMAVVCGSAAYVTGSVLPFSIEGRPERD